MAKEMIAAMQINLNDVIGDAQFTDKQTQAANYGGEAKLRPGYTYIIPAQTAVEVTIPPFTINGKTITSSKQVVAVAYRDGVPEAVIGLTWSSLHAVHVGLCEGETPKLEIALKEGKKVLKDSSLYEGIWQTGSLPTAGDNNKCCITKDVAFEVVKRQPCWQTQPILNTAGVYVPKEKDGYAVLEKKVLPLCRTLLAMPDWATQGWPQELVDHLKAHPAFERPTSK